jgi:hypothetical protein
MGAPKGFLLVAMEPPPALEEEFRDWYDTEHLPERLAVPGFESAQRYVCIYGWPRYLAFYDLSNPSVIDSTGYRAISGPRFSPWTKRMLARVQGFYRAYGSQLAPGHEATRFAARLTFARIRNVTRDEREELVPRFAPDVQREPGLVQVRLFQISGDGADDALLLVARDLRSTTGHECVRDLLGDVSSKVDLINEYAPIVLDR